MSAEERARLPSAPIHLVSSQFGMSPTGAMPWRENVETVRQGYEAFNRGDVEWMIARLDPEIVWEDAAEVPGTCSHRGIRAVRAYLESFAQQWEEIRFEPESVLDAGERVVALVRMVARGRASGAPVDARLAHLYDLREGRGMRVLRVRTFFDRQRALEAAGLLE
jgi:ketosteroid isomerase-like protein